MIYNSSRKGLCEHDSKCGRKILARRLCRSHYEKAMKSNVGRIKTPVIRPEAAEDLWAFVVRELKKQKHEIAAKL